MLTVNPRRSGGVDGASGHLPHPIEDPGDQPKGQVAVGQERLNGVGSEIAGEVNGNPVGRVGQRHQLGLGLDQVDGGVVADEARLLSR